MLLISAEQGIQLNVSLMTARFNLKMGGMHMEYRSFRGTLL